MYAAAKNLSEDELYKLGYCRAKILTNPANDIEKLIDLTEACTREGQLIGVYRRRDDYTKSVDRSVEQSEMSKVLGLYKSALEFDLLALSRCKTNLGNYHHKTLTAICNLSDDYLILNKPNEALAFAQEAFNTSNKIYGEHPCTVYTIHSLTNVYRKLGRYDDALAKDLEAYDLCKKIFVKDSAHEPQETLNAIADIADDYKGLKDYPSAIKHYEDYLSKNSNTHDPKVAEARNNLAHLYNVTGKQEKALRLYDFLRAGDNSYSLDELPIYGIISAQTADVLGDTLAAVGKKEEAIKIYNQEIVKFEVVRYHNSYAIETSENKRQWFAQTVPYYKKIASFFVSQNANAEAFRAVELCKGRTLADQHNDSFAIYKGGLTQDEILKLNEYQEKTSWYKDNFSKEFMYGDDALKFNLRMAQLIIMEEYNTYRDNLVEKYPKYEEALKGGRLDIGIRSERLFNAEQMKALIPARERS